MSFDDRLASRIRAALDGEQDVREIQMFGGLCFTIGGHMCCGLAGADLMVRLGPDAYPKGLQQPHTRPMDFTGRPLKGFVFVAPSGARTTRALARWVGLGAAFARSLPPKKRKAVRSRAARARGWSRAGSGSGRAG